MSDSGEREEAEFVSEEDSEDRVEDLDPEEGAAALVGRLRAKLKRAVAEKQEYLEGWQRARADFANYKKQEEHLVADRSIRTKAEVVEALLPTLDSFEAALHHAPNKELDMLYRQLLGSLAKAGVEQFGAAGEPFDPHRHEALREEPVAEAKQDHTIVSVERSGYTLGDFVIRPAQVAVGAYKKST